MTAFVLQQMDYVFFVHGLSFFLVSAICFYISSNSKAPPGWQWLGAFGALHGTRQWLHLGALSLGDDPYCQWLRVGIVLLSFLCLCEFGQRAAKRLPRFYRRRWVYPPLLALAAAGAVYGLDGLDVTVRYALGLVGGLWTAWALFRLSQEPRRPGRRWLAAAAAVFRGLRVRRGADRSTRGVLPRHVCQPSVIPAPGRASHLLFSSPAGTCRGRLPLAIHGGLPRDSRSNRCGRAGLHLIFACWRPAS